MINNYSFGHMELDGKNYSSDLIIFPDGSINPDWKRKEGHKLDAGDIIGLMDDSPELIVIGTGAYGCMIPSDNLLDTLGKKGIDYVAEPSGKASTLYNELSSVKRVGACFHLTC